MITKNEINFRNLNDHPLSAGVTAYVPSVLFLIMALDNGWEIVHVVPAAVNEKSEPGYHVTLQIQPEGHCQELLVPHSKLIEKLFEQKVPQLVRVC